MGRKIVAVILAALFTLLFPTVVFAEDADLSFDQTSNVTFDVEGRFMVYIPMEIVVGETVQIRADEINIPDNKQIQILFDGFNSSDNIQLTNGMSDDIVEVYFTKPNGDKYTNSDRVIGVFNSESQGEFFEFSSYAMYNEVDAKAGTYSGTVRFYINYTDVQ